MLVYIGMDNTGTSYIGTFFKCLQKRNGHIHTLKHFETLFNKSKKCGFFYLFIYE